MSDDDEIKINSRNASDKSRPRAFLLILKADGLVSCLDA